MHWALNALGRGLHTVLSAQAAQCTQCTVHDSRVTRVSKYMYRLVSCRISVFQTDKHFSSTLAYPVEATAGQVPPTPCSHRGMHATPQLLHRQQCENVSEDTIDKNGLSQIQPGRWDLTPLFGKDGEPVEYLNVQRDTGNQRRWDTVGFQHSDT